MGKSGSRGATSRGRRRAAPPVPPPAPPPRIAGEARAISLGCLRKRSSVAGRNPSAGQVAPPPDGGQHLGQIGLLPVGVVDLVGGHHREPQPWATSHSRSLRGRPRACRDATTRVETTPEHLPEPRRPPHGPGQVAREAAAGHRPCQQPESATMSGCEAPARQVVPACTARSFSPRNWPRVTKTETAAVASGDPASSTRCSVGGGRPVWARASAGSAPAASAPVPRCLRSRLTGVPCLGLGPIGVVGRVEPVR
jgi:hypothetical protein